VASRDLVKFFKNIKKIKVNIEEVTENISSQKLLHTQMLCTILLGTKMAKYSGKLGSQSLSLKVNMN